MNRIFRKCKDFGLMTRISTLNKDIALDIAKGLIKGNAPVITIDISKNPESKKVLNHVAFNADLFIAAEGIKNISDAYEAAANGAQFFILDKPDEELVNSLKSSGFFFMTRVSNNDEIVKSMELEVEAVVISDLSLVGQCQLPFVIDNIADTSDSLIQGSVFSIMNIENSDEDYERWINTKMQGYLGHRYIEVVLKENATESEISFAKLFSSLNKSKLTSGSENIVYMECNNLIQTINYLKWKDFYADPNDSKVEKGRIVSAHLDNMLNGFKVIIEEKK